MGHVFSETVQALRSGVFLHSERVPLRTAARSASPTGHENPPTPARPSIGGRRAIVA